MTTWAVAAGSAGVGFLPGSTAAGIAELFRGRAFFPVTNPRDLFVRLAARAGVFGCIFLFFSGNLLPVVVYDGFWHSCTCKFCEGIITHMRINHLKDRILQEYTTKNRYGMSREE